MVKRIGLLLLVVSLASACASMPTKQRRAREAAEIGLVSHPELGDIMAALARLDAKYDTLLDRMNVLLDKMNVVEEAHRDDTATVFAEIAKARDELLAALRARR